MFFAVLSLVFSLMGILISWTLLLAQKKQNLNQPTVSECPTRMSPQEEQRTTPGVLLNNSPKHHQAIKLLQWVFWCIVYFLQ